MATKHSAPGFILSSYNGRPTPITLLHATSFAAWVAKQPASTRMLVEANQFNAAPGSLCILQEKSGLRVLCGVEETPSIWSVAHLPGKLAKGVYRIDGRWNVPQATQLALGWALGCYRFGKYKKETRHFPALLAPEHCDMAFVESAAAAAGWARDLINTPANDMTPETLAAEAMRFGKQRKGELKVIVGEALLKENFPMIHAVGKAAAVAPRLVDMRFSRKGAPKVTLVGKGVTFDSGGLDIKTAGGMKLMKKDMGGAANVLALAQMILDAKLPVQLRVLLPLVENAIGGNAMRPLDIVPTRKGIHVEIGNTDAEGRLILCDALAEADSETPDLLIDCATLTGAARVALGTEIPAFFTNDDTLAAQLAAHAQSEADPLWRLPLWKPYRSLLNTPNADLSNDPDSSYGGAITAALYLQEFVGKTPSWLHIDMMAWNLSDKPGRPQGGEAMGIRALFALLKERYGH